MNDRKAVIAMNEPEGGCPTKGDCAKCVHFIDDYCYYPRVVRTLSQIAEAENASS
jgi:hypothetical protein